MNRSIRPFLCAAALGGAAAAARAEETTRFIFADVGTTYTGFIFPNDPRIGREVVLTRIFLVVDVAAGANAADFDTDVTFPIEPGEGSTPVLSLTGAGLDWSGSGTFTYETETTMFNGVVEQTLFGGATSPMDAVIREDSYIEMVFAPVPAPGAGVLVALGGAAVARRRRR